MPQGKQYIFIGAAWLLFACSNTNNTEVVTDPVEQKETITQICKYSYDSASTHLYWTAFKHSGKVEVKGQMDSLQINGTVTAGTIIDAIKNASFIIYPGSVDSKDSGRDQKITSFFFGSMAATENITGSIKSIDGNEKNGKGIISLTLNNVSQNVEMEYVIEEETIQFRCDLDFMDWNCTDAIKNLQKACAEKHTGIDGKTVFWPDAKILIETTLIKDCR
jgi:hypothetical protein